MRPFAHRFDHFMESQASLAAVYVAKPEFLPALCEEVGGVIKVVENLVFSSVCNTSVCFAQDVWLSPEVHRFESISQAVSLLRQAGKYWYLHPSSHIRRSRLIEEQLRVHKTLERAFPVNADIPPMGVFTLLDQNTLVYSTQRAKKWPHGQCYFIEDKANPPNRAYLKLWEALFLLNNYPQTGQTALDLGASPGGWTYVMASLGAQVTAVDKAKLDPKISRMPGVRFLQQSAFAIDPITLEHTYDWVLSDVACYPERAYALILKWIASGKAKQMIFTIKLQGNDDIAAIKQFQAIPNSKIINLFYNKHEATFFYPAYD